MANSHLCTRDIKLLNPHSAVYRTMSFHYSNPFLFILIEEIKYKMRTDSFKSGNKKKGHNKLLQFLCSDFLKQILPSFSLGCKLLSDQLLRWILTSGMSKLHYRRDRDDITKLFSCKVRGMVSLMKRSFPSCFNTWAVPWHHYFTSVTSVQDLGEISSLVWVCQNQALTWSELHEFRPW